MPFIKISGLTTATAVSATNQFEINQNGGSRSATVAQVAAFARTSATDPVVLPAGTVSAPALTFTGDTNTGIYSPAADTIAFTEGGVEGMRIDSAGNVGIGTVSPTQRLQVRQDQNATTSILVQNRNASGTPSAALQFISGAFDLADNRYAMISSDGGSNTTLQFYTGQGGAPVERMRIDASGRLGLGTSSPDNLLDIRGTSSPQITINNTSASANDTTDVTLGTFGGSTPFWSRLNYNASQHIWRIYGTERMRVDASGNVGIGTSSPGARLHVSNGQAIIPEIYSGSSATTLQLYTGTAFNTGGAAIAVRGSTVGYNNDGMEFFAGGAERARITGAGSFCVNATAPILGVGSTSVGFGVEAASTDGSSLFVSRATNIPVYINRNNDGALVAFHRAGTQEGSISVSGSTVSYNGGHLARWSQLPNSQRDPALLKGTVLSNLDEMCEWLDPEGNPLPNEQLNRVKVSDVEGDPNVAGVFVNWDNDDQANPYDMNIAMTGDMIIRICAGVVVQKGDLLMSAGDGTAKPQGDDIRRSKTVAKVTSNHITCTYADGSYCVPCVLMAC